MNQKLKNVIFILLLGSISTTLLSGVRNYTAPKIKRYKEVRLRSTILRAAGVEHDKENVDEAFLNNIRTVEKGGFAYYLSPKGLYIFEFEGRGLWGMIEGTITLNPDLKTIENLDIISQEETPGLGGRISEKSFLDQFRKKIVSPKLFLAVRKKAAKDNEVDSITGASMTSQALVDMINKAVEDFRGRAGE